MEQEPKEIFQGVVDHLEEYVETQKEIIRLQTVKHGSAAVGNIAAVLLLALFLLVAYIFLNVGLAAFLSRYTGSLSTSFLYVGGANFFVAIMVALLRNTLVVRPVQNLLIKLITQ